MKKKVENSLTHNLMILAISFLLAFGIGYLIVGQFQETILKLIVQT